MKIILVLSSVLIVICAACGKDKTGCMGVKPEEESSQILAYSATTGGTYTKHGSGLYYNIPDSGSGVRPYLSSYVSVRYTGKLLNGVTFDSGTATLSLSNVIEGWQIGIPLIKKGGRIQLLIPSALAYGCNGRSAIPPNSVLFFDVSLIDVQ